MKLKKKLILFSFLLVALVCIGSAAATEDVNVDDNNFTEDSSVLKLETNDEPVITEDSGEGELSIADEDILSEPKTIVVEEVEEYNIEMLKPTIQKAIDEANAGDTIIIQGRSYIHCHFIVDKPLTIKSEIGTTMSECPGNVSGSGHYGIFYVSPQASGTIIEGFTINTGSADEDDDYGIFVAGASDVIIRDCKISSGKKAHDAIRVDNVKNALIENVTLFNVNNGLRVKNSENVTVRNINSFNSKNGIFIIDSINTQVISSNLSDNAIAGISYSGNGKYLTVRDNNISNNGDGIRLTSTNQVLILSNCIAFNKNNGVYVDYNVTKLEIRGNFFNQNIKWDVFNDFHVKNMIDRGNEKEIVTNNYMINYGFGSGDMDRPVWTQMYEYRPGTSYADYAYDAVNDVYTYVGEGNGDYYGHQEVMFLGYVFDINNFLSCPNMYVSPEKIWSKMSAKESLELELSEITQVKKGVYSISIVDVKGNIITDISSVPVTFYLNKVGISVNPQEGDIYKTVMMKNGTATVTFDKSDFNETGNVITAVFPTPGTNFDKKVSKTFSINDSDIPGSEINTNIISSNAYMVPNLSEYYTVTLKDENGNALSDKSVTLSVNGKDYAKTTDSKGQAKVSLKFTSEKTYKITVKFAGDDNYNPTSKTSSIIVKYSSKTTKLTAPKVTIPPKTYKYYSVTLKDGNGKAIAKQKITIKVNGKTYTKTTNSKGKAKIKVKFNSLKTYKVTASYKGNKIYKKTSASGKIIVAKTVTKITTPKVSILPKQSKTYTITLKTSAGKALSKQKITIKVNGKTYSKKTNSKGKASVSVKFSSQKTYSVVVKYKGTGIYKASKATGKITVSKIATQIDGKDLTYSKYSSKAFSVTLKDKSGKALSSQAIKFTVNGKTYSKTTNSKGVASIDLSSQNPGTFNIVSKYAGNSKYKAASKTNKIVISDKDNLSFVNAGLTNSEIQAILDNAGEGYDVEFLGSSYKDVALNIDKSLNIYSKGSTLLKAKNSAPVFTVAADNVNISNFTINGNSWDGIVISNASNILISNNHISNSLEESKIPSYANGSLMLPGYGISLLGSSDVLMAGNSIKLFESGIFAQDSSGLIMDSNTLRENNYGIKYGFGVANTQITNNEIVNGTGLYIMTVPEGPSGYGIFLNNSAVNVTINYNHIAFNHMGISLDAKNSTGIVITQNTITDNVLEGIRFNAGYDIAPNATKAIVTDNAIYRNARGPSMMILGELSANPEGIYGGGLQNPSERLQLDANWYGKNDYTTWDFDNGIVGYGTMCPRINTTYIVFNNITCQGPGNYSITFYKKGEVASNLPKFDLYATLNRGTDKQIEVVFDVENGVGSFNFNADNYDGANNTLEISIGSLINSTTRVFLPIYKCTVSD